MFNASTENMSSEKQNRHDETAHNPFSFAVAVWGFFCLFFYLTISPCHHCPSVHLSPSSWMETHTEVKCQFLDVVSLLWLSLSSPSLHPLTETKGSSLRTLHPESEIFLRSISDCTPNQPTIPQTSPLTPTCTLDLFVWRLLSSNAPSSSLMKRASGRNVKLLPPCFTWCIEYVMNYRRSRLGC